MKGLPLLTLPPFPERTYTMKTALTLACRRALLSTFALVLFAAATAPEAFAQRGDRLSSRGSVLYGDLKVEGMATDGTFQVILYAGVAVMQQTIISSGGRYRFSGVPNGEYTIVVQYENQGVYRNLIRIAENQPTDVRHDITLTAQAPAAGKANASSGVVYNRSSGNQSLYDGALALIEKKQMDEAVAALKKVVASDAKDYVAWTELGTVYFKQEKHSDADASYQKALEAKPDYLLAMINQGKLRLAQKNFDGAIEVLSKAVAQAPASADVQYYLGESYLGARKGSKAVGHLNEAIRLDPMGKADVHLRLATLYNAAGMKDKAVLEYEQFLQKRPDYAEKKKIQDYISQNKTTQ